MYFGMLILITSVLSVFSVAINNLSVLSVAIIIQNPFTPSRSLMSG